MQAHISKTLEGIIARTAFNTTKAGIRHALKDYLLLELLREEGALAYQLLTERLQPWELYQLRLRLEQAVECPSQEEVGVEPEQFLRRFTNELCARNSHLGTISTGHALLAILDDPTAHAATIFARYRITHEVITTALAKLGGEHSEQAAVEVRLLDAVTSHHLHETSAKPLRHATPLLDKFGTDLTAEARAGRLDTVVGRDAEIERVIRILTRRKKNNPVLIGEAGVGKTAIAEGLALRMAAGEVPYALLEKRLFALDVATLIAGTKFRGEFEERIRQLIDELKLSRDTLLFIDELHTIVGAGATQGSLDTANILKPALARGEVQVVGATTLDEYREHIERDKALERRFQRVVIEPTSHEATRQILRRIAPRYEQHHRVHYTEEALHACIELSERYLTDRYLPDKAIDLLDEAGALICASTANESASLQALQTRLAATQRERHEALEAACYDRAAEARMEELQLRATLTANHTTWQQRLDEQPATVDRAAIERTITAMTGIPIERIAGCERERLKGLQHHLMGRVVGQQEAVKQLSQAILRARVGLKEPHRPIGVFLFVGPTGVGKTLLAKEVSRWLFDEQRGLIRLDMSEYSEKHNIARLIGSPPGYVGYGEGGQLTEAVRRHPYAVVLFDEIEKAHPEVFNTLLQLFDEGHLTDGAGRRVDFRNTILIMTSNVGSREGTANRRRAGYATTSHRTEGASTSVQAYRKVLEMHFAPELLNRIDDIVVFRALTSEDVAQIVEMELAALATRTRALGYGLRITARAKQRLTALGYEPRYGARALKRTLTDHIEEPLARLIVEERLSIGDTILVEADRRTGIRFRVA